MFDVRRVQERCRTCATTKLKHFRIRREIFSRQRQLDLIGLLIGDRLFGIFLGRPVPEFCFVGHTCLPDLLRRGGRI